MTGLPQIVDMSNPAGFARGISLAKEALGKDRLVGVPTETVYGLAGDATSDAAVAAIFSAKARPHFNPLIIHTVSLEAAEQFATFNADARRLGEALWPGPLTLVMPLRRPSDIAGLATVGLDTVAIRVPEHPVAQALIHAFGKPVAAPSANRSGHVSPTTAGHVAGDLGDKVAVILDAGPTGIGVESTIVGCVGGDPVLLRSGGVPRHGIADLLGRPLSSPSSGSDTAPAAPGMLASHYAPAATLRLNATEVRPGEALMAFGPDLPTDADKATASINLSEAGDLHEAAARLFAALRELDEKAEAIAVAPIPETDLGEAINDRLRRAAAPRG